MGGRNMASKEIPRSEWRGFLERFSNQHEGWLTTIEIAGGQGGSPGLEATELPLIGISIENRDEPDEIEISVGDVANEVTHVVENAVRVVFEEAPDGGHEGLDIESANGEKTIVRFRSAMRPEMLDGVVDDHVKRAGGS